MLRKIFNTWAVVYNRAIAMRQQKTPLQPNRRNIVLLVLVALGLYILLPQIGGFRSSRQLLQHPNAGYTALAIILTFGTYAAGTGTYCLLAFKKLRVGQTFLAQLAAMFVNRLLPAGIGAVGANYLYLRHEKHTASQAASVVAINNIWGFTGHGLLVGVTLLLIPGTSMIGQGHHDANFTLIGEALLVLGVVLGGAGLLFGRKRVAGAISDFKMQLLSYRKRPLRLILALCTSMLLTLCNVLCLFFCLKALGMDLSFAAVLLVFTFGVGTGAAVPTPGGLGGFEAGLAAGFVAYGIDASPALAAALLYRLVSYWLPLAAGLMAFIMCQRQKLFTLSAGKTG